MSRPAGDLLLALGAVAVVTIAWVAWPTAATPAQPPAAPAPTNAQPAATTPAVQPAVAAPVPAAPAPTAPGKPGKGSMRYPDGSSHPALNGVDSEVVLNWGTGPMTKIVGVEDGPGGWQWYVHENGTRSTTAMVTMNGVPQAMGFVAEPHQTLPRFDEASFQQQLQQQGTPPTRR